MLYSKREDPVIGFEEGVKCPVVWDKFLSLYVHALIHFSRVSYRCTLANKTKSASVSPRKTTELRELDGDDSINVTLHFP